MNRENACLCIIDGNAALGVVTSWGPDMSYVTLDHTGETVRVPTPETILIVDIRDGERASSFLRKLHVNLRVADTQSRVRVDVARENA